MDKIRLAAVGDLLLSPPPPNIPYLRSLDLVSPSVRELFAQCNVVFANLECCLPGTEGCVPAEPRVTTTPELIRGVKNSGVTIVTLANNHTFDYFKSGFENLRHLLAEIELPHFGAGLNLREATAPVQIDYNGVRMAFVAAVDERSGMNTFAVHDRYGVAPLDVDRLVQQIRELRTKVDHVLVSVHWGEERFFIPSPLQIEQAHSFIDAGASLVLGHHPHVLQGLEMYNNRPIIYSLGNFTADEVFFSSGDAVRWNRTGRTGAILLADLARDEIRNVRLVPTFDSGQIVAMDQSSFGQHRIAKTSAAVARGVTASRYCREHFWVKAIKPALHQLHWSNLPKLRPGKIIRGWQSLWHAMRAK